ncbi:MAG: nucleotidyltransferase family protein [Nanoarchaeota archaeon]|nr:nucleotidyltransferase family protein [Nanoarchaeota archaeon]MBU1501320.1 nucleotidyltransferase family protein [Nanoarchaeota archaeon]MBU2459431.1 nucleotidyltransferase family protein [Nanoarchaeota archaeon]
MKAIILAAGFGTRLHPFTLEKPKSLLEIKGMPLIDYIIEKIPRSVDETILVSNAKFYSSFLEWKKTSGAKLKILNDGVLVNEERLGGIADLWLAIQREKINDDLLIILGDNFFDFNLETFLDLFYKDKKISIGLYQTDFQKAKKFGVAEVEGNDLIDIEEKPDKPKSDLIVTGLYLIPKEKISLIQEYMKTNKDKGGITYLIKDWLGKEKIKACTFKGGWEDIGDVETYEKLK